MGGAGAGGGGRGFIAGFGAVEGEGLEEEAFGGGDDEELADQRGHGWLGHVVAEKSGERGFIYSNASRLSFERCFGCTDLTGLLSIGDSYVVERKVYFRGRYQADQYVE